MTVLWITWAACAVPILAVYVWVGKATTRNALGEYNGSVFGLLIDDRGRYSLNRFQLALWTLVILSLTAGVFVARAATRGLDPLDFTIPGQVLGLLGISVGSAAVVTGVKAHKNRTRTEFVAASLPGEATFAQMLMVEEGPQADKIVDVYKLQSFLITFFLAAAYVVLAIHTYAGWGAGPPITSPADIDALPAFSGTFLTLLAISQAGYVGGKLPDRGQDLVQDVPKESLADVSADQTVVRETGRPVAPKKRARPVTSETRQRRLERSRRASAKAAIGGGGVPATSNANSATGDVSGGTDRSD